MDLLRFSLALENFALVFHIIRALNWDSAMAHRLICLQIAMQAPAEGRTQHLGQLYDSISRKEWAERSRREDVGFDVNVAARTVCADCLNRAKAVYDARGTSNGESRGTRVIPIPFYGSCFFRVCARQSKGQGQEQTVGQAQSPAQTEQLVSPATEGLGQRRPQRQEGQQRQEQRWRCHVKDRRQELSSGFCGVFLRPPCLMSCVLRFRGMLRSTARLERVPQPRRARMSSQVWPVISSRVCLWTREHVVMQV